MNVLGNSVLILPDKQPTMTKSGKLHIPVTAESMAPEEGTVIGVGPACKEVKTGGRVVFSRKSASVADIDGVVHYFHEESKILYIYEQR